MDKVISSSLSNLSEKSLFGSLVDETEELKPLKEMFGSSSSSSPSSNCNNYMKSSPLSSLINLVFIGIALYLALQCKYPETGAKVLNVILAICCAPCYIVYRLIKPCAAAMA